MSRYEIPSRFPHLTVAVGWDDALQTFYAQVDDTTLPAEADQCIVWLGMTFQAIPRLEALDHLLQVTARIPGPVYDQLFVDWQASETQRGMTAP